MTLKHIEVCKHVSQKYILMYIFIYRKLQKTWDSHAWVQFWMHLDPLLRICGAFVALFSMKCLADPTSGSLDEWAAGQAKNWLARRLTIRHVSTCSSKEENRWESCPKGRAVQVRADPCGPVRPKTKIRLCDDSRCKPSYTNTVKAFENLGPSSGVSAAAQSVGSLCPHIILAFIVSSCAWSVLSRAPNGSHKDEQRFVSFLIFDSFHCFFHIHQNSLGFLSLFIQSPAGFCWLPFSSWHSW